MILYCSCGVLLIVCDAKANSHAKEANTPIVASTPSLKWAWARSAGGTGQGGPWRVAIDSSKNVYVSGWFGSVISFGGTTLTSVGDWDVFVCKYDPNGNLLWAKRYGGPNREEGESIATDRQNNIYISGYFEGTTQFGNFSATSKGDRDIFITKCDSDGNVLWFTTAGGLGYDEAHGVTLDTAGNIYTTGLFTQTATFGQFTLTSRGNQDAFDMKCDPTGKILWAEQLGGYGDPPGYGYDQGDRGIELIADAVGNTYLTGQFNGTSYFGNDSLISAGDQDIFVTKLNTSGNVLWAVRGGGTNSDCGQAVALDTAQKNVYAVGYFWGMNAIFGDTTITGFDNNDAFLMKLDTSGNIRWIDDAGGANDDYGFGIAVDPFSNCYMSGAYSSSPATFGNMNVNSVGGLDIFVAEYDSNGAFDTVLVAGSPDPDLGHDIQPDQQGNFYLAGFYSDAINFDATQLTSTNGTEQAFLSKLHSSAPPKTPTVSSSQSQVINNSYCDTLVSDTLYIHNTGDTSLTIYTSYFNGGTQYYRLASPVTFPVIIPPGDSWRFIIQFSSSFPVVDSTVLNLISNDTTIGHNPWKIDFVNTLQRFTVNVSCANDTASPGDTARIPVVVHAQSPLVQLAGVSYLARVSYNSSILLPVRMVNGTIDSIGAGYVVFTCSNAADTAWLICIVGLGDSVATQAHIDTVEWFGCEVIYTTTDAMFTLSGLCTQGGTRLFLADSGVVLSQNEPNPFNGTTAIYFRTVETGQTRLWISDMLGRRQVTLIDGYIKPGAYNVDFNGNGLPGGVYVYVLQTPSQSLTKTLIIEK